MLNRRPNANMWIEPVRKAIEKSGANLRYAAIFGSCLTRESDPFSDIDLLVVCENGSDKRTIQKEMQKLGRSLDRAIHLNDYLSYEFEGRIRFHDYKLASILQDALVLVNNGSHDTGLNQLKSTIDENSIRFNEIKGVETLHKAMENLGEYKRRINITKSPLENSRDHRYIQNLSIRHSHMALGYLHASRMMRQKGRTATLGLLLEEVPLMRELIQADDTIKRMGYISPEKTEEYVQNVKSEFARILPSDIARSIH